jgi:cytochrome c-type biogenesis protein CcmH/NrfG
MLPGLAVSAANYVGTVPDDRSGLPELAYELSKGALERQERVLDELRARTGTLLAASSIAASFLGAQAAREHTGVLTFLAVAAFVVSILAATYVLLPKPNLVYSVRGSVLFEEEFQSDLPLEETHRRLAYWLEQFHDQNQVTVDRLFFFFRLATFAVLLQVVLWVTEIAF